MFDAMMNSLFGCSHRKTSFPITPMRRNSFPGSNYAGHKRIGTYVVCLDCGKEFDYNWKEMQVGEPLRTGLPAPAGSFLVAK